MPCALPHPVIFWPISKSHGCHDNLRNFSQRLWPLQLPVRRKRPAGGQAEMLTSQMNPANWLREQSST